jgi:hypothetical protein
MVGDGLTCLHSARATPKNTFTKGKAEIVEDSPGWWDGLHISHFSA